MNNNNDEYLHFRKIKKEIKVLEDELPRAQVLVFPMTGINPVEFEPQTLAVLRGRLVRYLMRSREVIILISSKNLGIQQICVSDNHWTYIKVSAS